MAIVWPQSLVPTYAPMLFLQRRPAPPLDLYVESLWLCRAPHRARTLDRVQPTGAPQLILNLAEDRTRAYERRADRFDCRDSPGSILTGVTTRCQIIDTDEQEHVAGVAFRPGGTVPFIAGPASALRDVDVPLATLWGARGICAVA